jgi:hypothetical protein
MFAAMAVPLKGAGGVLSPAKKERRRCRVAPPPFVSFGSYSDALRFTAAERPRSVAIS